MKKFFTLILSVALLMMYYGASAQCTINTSNTTDGFTPTSITCITAGTAYGQQVNVHIPASGTFGSTSVTIDSVQLLSVTGMPAGITTSGNPASGVIVGGGNGCLWFSGTTNAASGSYPLVFDVRIWAKYSGFAFPPVDTTLSSLGYNFSLDVCNNTPTACTINTGVTTTGFTPASLPCITQGTAYGQQDNVHVPATITYSTLTVNVDSVKLLSVTGMPSGIAVTGNPASGVIKGGNNGCLWYSGTTNAAANSYPLTFNVRVWVHYMTYSSTIDTTMAGLGYPFSLSVCAPAVTVTASVTPSGPDSICTGGSTTLTANAGSGYTYRWSDASHSTTQAITVSASGSYKVTVHSGTDSAVSAPVTVVVVSPPSATVTHTGTGTICQGDTLTLTAPAGTGYTYLWSPGPATTASIRVTAAGSYAVTVSGTHGCTATSAATSISVTPLPTATITQAGATLTSSVGSSYQWYVNDTPVTGVGTGQSYTATVNGSYTVKVTTNGCSAVSSDVRVSVLGITDIDAIDGLILYPNPNNGSFTLQSTGSTGKEFAVYDVTGRVVAQQAITADKMNVQLKGLPSGSYTLQVKGDSSKAVRFTIK